MPRFEDSATMMRLPTQPTTAGLDVCFVGVPANIGASNRSGSRFGSPQIRANSCMIRPYYMATRAAPFESLQLADIGYASTFASDVLVPGFSPGTGSPEIGSLPPIQGIEITRGCCGLNIIDADCVEVSPLLTPIATPRLPP